MINSNSSEGQALARQIVEFEAWCITNGSKDLNVFAKERRLAPEVIRELKRCQQMEEELSSLAGGAEFESSLGKVGGPANRTIGNYQLLNTLGVGGMGTVWLAQQSHPMKRTVAIKLIRPDRDSSETEKRFEREKQALALMSHAHVAQVYEAGTSTDGRQYIAMEYVDGESITDYCKNRQSTLVTRLELFLQLCSAIQHAHQVGLLHRDIKPDNILVTEVDGKPIVKVIDFGLVRPSETWDIQITDPDMIVGSPLWMSPEQAGGSLNAVSKNGTTKLVDARTDVYSLGVILYQLLTDTTPITEEQYNQATKFDLLNTIHNEVPELPSSRVGKSKFSDGDSTPVSSWGSVLRNELDWVTMRALEKECDRRYATVQSFAEDIESYLKNDPVTARPPSLSYRLTKLAQKHRTATLSMMVICGLVAMFSAGIWWLSNETSNQIDLAEKAEKRRGNTEHRMALMLMKYNPSSDGEVFEEAHLRMLDDYRNIADNDDYSDDPLWEAEYRQMLADAYSGSAEYTSAFTQYEKVVKIYSDASESHPRQRIAAKLRLAEEHSLHWADDKALPIAKACFDESEDRYGDNDELTLAARAQTNRSKLPFGNNDEIANDLEKTVGLAKSALGESHPVTIKAMTALGMAFEATQNQVEAGKQIRKALELATNSFGPNDRRTMELQIQVLEIGGRTGSSNPDSRKVVDELYDEYHNKFGPEHLFTVRARQAKASLAILAGEFKTAENELEDLIEVCREKFGKTHAATMKSRNLLGSAHFQKYAFGRISDSARCLERSKEIFTEMIEDCETMNLSDSSFAFKARGTRASVLSATGEQKDLEIALDIAEKYLPKSEKLFGIGSLTTASFRETRQTCLFKMGHQEEAVKLADQWYRKSMKIFDQPSIYTASAAHSLAEFYRKLGRRKEASKYLERKYDLLVKLWTESADLTVLSLADLYNEQACLGDYESAKANAKKVIEHMSERLASRSEWILCAEVTIGECLCEQGQFEEGRRRLELVLKSCSKANVHQRLIELRAQSALALCEIAEGSRSDAITTLELTLASLKELESENPLAKFAWIVDRCAQRLAKFESAQ